MSLQGASALYNETNEGPPDLPASDPDIWTEIHNYLGYAVGRRATGKLGYYYDTLPNYSILQGVIEQQSGMDYTDYVTENVLLPAGMDPQNCKRQSCNSKHSPNFGVYSGPR